MPPIVYSTGNRSGPTKGPLPIFASDLNSPTWEELNELSKQGKNIIKDDCIAYLNADLDGSPVAKAAAIASMNTKLQTSAADVSASGDYSSGFIFSIMLPASMHSLPMYSRRRSINNVALPRIAESTAFTCSIAPEAHKSLL